MALLDLSDLLGKLWPPERVIVGMRTCKVLRECIISTCQHVLLCARSQQKAGDSDLDGAATFKTGDVVQSLNLFRHAGLVFDVDMFSCGHESLDAVLGAFVQSNRMPSIRKLKMKDWTQIDEVASSPSSQAPDGLLRALRLVEAMTNLEHLHLSANSLGAMLGGNDQALNLAKCSALTCLDLSDSCLGSASGWSHLAQGRTSLKSLVLRNNFGRFDDSDHGLAKCLNSLPGLTLLDLSENGMHEEEVCKLAESLQLNTELRVLVWSQSASPAVSGVLLSRFPNLTDLDLSASKIGTRSILALTGALVSQMETRQEGFDRMQLTSLNLSSNRINALAAKSLAGLIAISPRLKTLDLSNNAIGISGSTHVVAGLAASCPMLETLLLRNNVIGAAAASAFGPLADGCQELQELDLGENELGAEGVSELVHVLQGCLALRKLGLSQTALGAKGVSTVLRKLWGSWRRLHHLDLSANSPAMHTLSESKLASPAGQHTSQADDAHMLKEMESKVTMELGEWWSDLRDQLESRRTSLSDGQFTATLPPSKTTPRPHLPRLPTHLEARRSLKTPRATLRRAREAQDSAERRRPNLFIDLSRCGLCGKRLVGQDVAVPCKDSASLVVKLRARERTTQSLRHGLAHGLAHGLTHGALGSESSRSLS